MSSQNQFIWKGLTFLFRAQIAHRHWGFHLLTYSSPLALCSQLTAEGTAGVKGAGCAPTELHELPVQSCYSGKRVPCKAQVLSDNTHPPNLSGSYENFHLKIQHWTVGEGESSPIDFQNEHGHCWSLPPSTCNGNNKKYLNFLATDSILQEAQKRGEGWVRAAAEPGRDVEVWGQWERQRDWWKS